MDKVNSTFDKFVEEQTPSAFIPWPMKHQRRYYRTSKPLFAGPYAVPPGLGSLTVDKASEPKKCYFKNTKNLFIHIALIPIGDIPRVHPNILKCLHYSPVAKGLVVIATRAMMRTEHNHHVILYPLAYARGCVNLRSHILIFLLLILLISHHIQP